MYSQDDQIRRYAPVINSLVSVNRMLQEEAWNSIWKTKSSRHSLSAIPKTTGFILRRIKEIFGAASEVIFEPGLENQFSLELAALIEDHGAKVIQVLSRFVFDDDVNEEISSQVLLLLGRLDDPRTYAARLELVLKGLRHVSPRVRNAASYALGSIDDPEALPYLVMAIQDEEHEELRGDMEQVMKQLESTDSAIRSEKNT